MPVHRKVLLWSTVIPLLLLAYQLGMRLWLLQAGEPVVGVVTVVADSCRKNRANCYWGRAIVNPRMDGHVYSTTKISGGRFYTVGEEIPMRVYPAQRLYLAQTYDRLSWILGPVRTVAALLLLLIAAAMPAARKVLWITPCVLVLFLVFG